MLCGNGRGMGRVGLAVSANGRRKMRSTVSHRNIEVVGEPVTQMDIAAPRVTNTRELAMLFPVLL